MIRDETAAFEWLAENIGPVINSGLLEVTGEGWVARMRFRLINDNDDASLYWMVELADPKHVVLAELSIGDIVKVKTKNENSPF